MLYVGNADGSEPTQVTYLDAASFDLGQQQGSIVCVVQALVFVILAVSYVRMASHSHYE